MMENRRASNVLLIAVTLAFCTLPIHYLHGYELRYFSKYAGLPIPSGMREIIDISDDYTFTPYTTPLQASGPVSTNSIDQFYRDTLPMLGWRSTGTRSFVRGWDQMTFDIKPAHSGTILIIHLAPAPLRP